MTNNTIFTAKSSFGDGLVMDFAPDNTQATCLTHALNATLLTMNGNELSLQNDMGNGRVETAYLPEGYIPVGTCEFGDIIYIASYNPLTNKSQIGCFPSPERNISSKELSSAEHRIDNSAFQDFNGKITNTSVKQVLIDNNLNPGDKYIIYVSQTDMLEKNYTYLSDLGNTDHIHGGFPKIVKLHIVSIEDSGKITYLDSSVRWYDKIKHTSSEINTSQSITKENIGERSNLDFYINIAQDTQGSNQPDIDSYRNLLSSGYSIFQSKVSGKLAILAELETITGFECTYNVYKTGTSTETVNGEVKNDKEKIDISQCNINYNIYDVYLNFHWSTDNYNINPKGIKVSTSEWVPKEVNNSREARSCYYKAWTYDETSNELLNNVTITQTITQTMEELETGFDITNSYKYTTKENNQDVEKEINGYVIGDAINYEQFKQDYNFDSFKENVLSKIKKDQSYSFNKITQYVENNEPIVGQYLIDLDQIIYNSNIAEGSNKKPIEYYTTNSDGELSEIKPYTIPDTIVNNYFKNSFCKKLGSFKVPVSQTVTIKKKTSGEPEETREVPIDNSNFIYHYKVTPVMTYGDLDVYEQEGYIDFSKINSGNIELTNWRYFNGENLSTIQLGLDCYVEEGKGIEEVVLEFCDNQGIAAAYHINNRVSYSGVMPLNIQLNQAGTLTNIDSQGNTIYHAGTVLDKKSSDSVYLKVPDGKAQKDEPKEGTFNTDYYACSNDAGIIYSNMLYLVKITVKYTTKDILGNYNSLYTSDHRVFYRWLWTNTSFNQYYTTLKDYNDQKLTLNLDIAPTYDSKLDTKVVDYKAPTTVSNNLSDTLSANVQQIKGEIDVFLDAGLQETYDTFSLSEGADSETIKEVLQITSYIGNTYVTSPNNNSYMNMQGTLQEAPILQPLVSATYSTANLSTSLLHQLGYTTDSSAKELWQDYTNYKNQWKVEYEDKTNTETAKINYYNYNYQETEVPNAPCKTQQLNELQNNKLKLNIELLDFSKYVPMYNNSSMSGTLIKPLISCQADLVKFGLDNNSDIYSTSGVYDTYINWALNDTHAVKIQGYDAKVSPYSGTGVPYWLSSTSYGNRPTIGGHTAGEMDRESILKNKYNILAFDNTWKRGNKGLRNYIMTKYGESDFTAYAKQNLPVSKVGYPSDVEDRKGCWVDDKSLNLDWPPFYTYVMNDSAGNKRMVNMASKYQGYIKDSLAATFGNIYKVSDEVSTQSVTVIKDIIYLQPYTSTYTVDMVYKAEFKKGDSGVTDFKPYLNINGYNYDTYVKKLLTNKPKDDINNSVDESIDKFNINIEIGSVLKTLPIQLQVNYKTPNTSIESFDTKYLFQPCNLGGKAPLMSISGTYNSDTLYIYKDGQLQPWDIYTPSVYSGSYYTSEGDLIFTYIFNIDPKNPNDTTNGWVSARDINSIRFEKTNIGSVFKYENGDLYLASSTNYKDEARINTRLLDDDWTDPDQIVYAFNSQEKLVPWLAVLK